MKNLPFFKLFRFLPRGRASRYYLNKDIPYFFVLDKTGMIVYTTSGEYTPEKLDKMEEFISQ